MRTFTQHSMMEKYSENSADARLIRAIGIPALAANIVNTTIGAGIFVLPALVAKGLGPAAPLAFLVCAIAQFLFVTCFAMAGSRVSLTGGLYAYVEVSFGRYVGFLAGILFYLTAVLSVAGVVNVLAGTIAAFLPLFGNLLGRGILMFLVYAVLVAINVRGVRAGAGAVTVVTLAKLIPLLVFIIAGLFFVKPSLIAWPGFPTSQALGDSVLLLIFAFVGIEVALMPSGEVRNPSRTVPRSIYLALAVTTIIYILIQLVAQGTLGTELGNNTVSPLAEAAGRFLGNFGRVLLLAGATISSFGFVTSDILSSPRLLFAFGRDGILPRWFAHVHPRNHSPHIAIITYALIAFVLSISSSFEALAVMANVAVLLLYVLCCAATWVLISRDVRTDGKPFSVPSARIFPIASIAFIIWILAHATMKEFMMTAAVLLVASMIYWVRSSVEKAPVEGARAGN